MNRYLMTAAVLALMAAPAFAQQDQHEHEGHPGGGGGGGGHEHAAPAAPAATPAAPAAARPAPAAAPQAPRGNADVNRAQGNRGFDNRGGGGNRPDNANRAPVGNADANRAQNNRANDNRGPDNRFDNNRGPGDNRGQGFGDNRGPGFGGNRPGNGYGSRPGNRTDFSGFRDFHRTFRAPQRFHAPSYNRPYGWSYRRWNYGETLPSLFWAQQYWLNDFDSYDLPPPPNGAVWVRYGNDALLIDRYSGEIITAEYGVFY